MKVIIEDQVLDIDIAKIWSDNILYKMLTETVSVPVKKIDECILIEGVTLAQMNILLDYLEQGIVEKDTIEELVAVLDYFGVLTIKKEYPVNYLVIKLEEEWYRRNLYNDAFSQDIIQNNDYNLIQVGNDNIKHTLKGAFALMVHRAQYVLSTRGQTNVLVRTAFPLYVNYYPREIYVNKKYINKYEKYVVNRNNKFSNHVINDVADYPIKKWKLKLYSNTLNYAPTTSDYFTLTHVSRFTNETFKGFNWNNVLWAGGYLVNLLLHYAFNRSDLDLFIYGLSEEEANNKIEEILLYFGPKSITRTAHALTFTAKYLKIQIILRLYKTQAEILHGFDVDSCCVGSDGTNIYMTKRSHYAFKHMVNFVDFDRASPTYEYRLLKYMKRGFSVYVPELDCTRIKSLTVDLEKRLANEFAKSLRGLDILLYTSYLTIPNVTIKITHVIADYDRTNHFDAFYHQLDTFKSNKYSPYIILNIPIPFYLVIMPDFSPASPTSPNKSTISLPSFPRILSNVSTLPVIPDLPPLSVARIHSIPAMKPCKPPKKSAYLKKLEEYRRALNELFRIPDDTDLNFSVPQSLGFKIHNPGEQATGTFHQTIISDLSLWYDGYLYSAVQHYKEVDRDQLEQLATKTEAVCQKIYGAQ